MNASTGRVLVASMAVAVVCAACGSAGDDSPTAASSGASPSVTEAASVAPSSSQPAQTTTTAVPEPTAPPTTPAPTTTENPFAAAGEVYLAARAANETGAEAVSQTYMDEFGTIEWAETPAFCAEMLAVDTTYHDFLTTFEWPAEVLEESDQLVVALEVRMAVFSDCAGRPGTMEGLSDALDGWGGSFQAVSRAQKKLHWAMHLSVLTA